MNLLFVHQNMPGQYREFVQWLARYQNHNIVFLTQRKNAPSIPGVTTVVYTPHHKPAAGAYGLSRVWEEGAGSGFGCVTAAAKLEKEHGFTPDIIIGHAGWGELTFLKELWPQIPIIGFFEYYYNMQGGIVGFDPNEPVSEHAPYMMRARNVIPLMNFEAVDLGQCPTYWQRDRFPRRFHDQMYVCHDGIRTDRLHPDPNARLYLRRLDAAVSRDDEIVTYVARNMETTRGFPTLMRALPKILSERPTARVLIVGGNDTSYGGKSSHSGGLRGQMEAEVGADVDWSRVHFLGQLPYPDFCRLIQLSTCHVYLTMPFVLSWSLIESMSMQATIVAADVAPVREAITHGETGMLVDFFDPDALASQVVDVLQHPADYAHLGPAARAHAVQSYDFIEKCLPVHIQKINDLLPKAKQMPRPAGSAGKIA